MAASCLPIETEFFRWFITDDVTGKRRLTTHRMDRKTALERYPDAEPFEPSREVRDVLCRASSRAGTGTKRRGARAGWRVPENFPARGNLPEHHRTCVRQRTDVPSK